MEIKVADDILKDLKRKNYAPFYLLDGEEDYYIDLISDFIEDNVLTEDEKIFNLFVTYGADISGEEIVYQCRYYPINSNYRVVIVKEAQMCKTLNILKNYNDYNSGTSQTILVLCYKHKEIDKRQDWVQKLRSFDSKGVYFTSKKMYENRMTPWIKNYAASKGLAIDEKAAALIVEFTGTSLTTISSQIDKIALFLSDKPEKEITPQLVENHIGISKEYNIQELISAVAHKDVVKANRIVKYFEANPKACAMPMLVASFYTFISRLILWLYLKSKNPSLSKEDAARALGINSTFILDLDYSPAIRTYNSRQLINAMHALRELDTRSKGFGNGQSTDQSGLLKEFIFKFMH